jgi:diketogulonate reductase-like aldo/keto reductase
MTVDDFNAVAAERGATTSQVAIAWVRGQQERSTIVPILGAPTRSQIDDSLGGLHLELTEHELERLDAVSCIALGFPHDFGRTLAYGDTFELIDDHHHISSTTR